MARFLTSHGGTPQIDKDAKEQDLKNQAVAGEKTFTRMGCAVCHEKQGDHPSRATLQALDQKTTVPALQHYLENPAEVDPAGRMPNFQYKDGGIAKEIAIYLTRRDAQTAAAFGPAPSAQRRSLGPLFCAGYRG